MPLLKEWFFHSLNFFKSFQKRSNEKPIRVSIGQLNILLSCPFFMTLQPLSIRENGIVLH